MGHFKFVSRLALFVSPIAFLLFLGGSNAQPEVVSPVLISELQQEIDRLLKQDEKAPASDQEKIATFERIEELALRLAEVGDYEAARSLAKKGVRFFPEERRSLTLLGWAEGLSGEYGQAIDTTRKALEAKAETLPDPGGSALKNAQTHLAGFLLHESRPAEAAQLLETVSRMGTDRGATQYLLGQAYFEQGEFFLAAKAYEKALREAPELADSEDYFRYATALDRMGKLDKAGAALRKGTEALPNASGLYLNLGLNAEATGTTREAYLHYRMEIEISGPDSPFTAAAEKRIERIETLQSKSSFPDAPLQALIAYLQLREDSRRPEKAEKDSKAKLEKAYSTYSSNTWPDHPYLRLLEADRLASSDSRDQAVALLQEARSQFPKQILFTLELANLYGEIGEASKSNELIRDAFLEAPGHWKAQRLVGTSSSPR